MKVRGILFGLVVATSFGIALFVVGQQSSASTSVAGSTDGAMAVDCDASQAGVQSDCTYAPGTSFSVQVYVIEAPAVGYAGLQVLFDWDPAVINYRPEPEAADEGSWSRCTIAARSPEPPTGDPPQLFGCAALPFPTEPFFDVAPVLNLAFQCKGESNTGSGPASLNDDEPQIVLIPGAPIGTYFSDMNLMPVMPALTGAVIRCAEPVPTTPTPTPVPKLRWDVDENGFVSIVDVGIVVGHFGETFGGTAPVVAGSDGTLAIDCDASRNGVQHKCRYAPGASFSVQVNVTEAPSTGYVAFQTLLTWDAGLITYHPASSTSHEALWRECTIARSSPSTGYPPQLFSCLAFPYPQQPFMDTGPVLEFDFSCRDLPKKLTQPAGLTGDQAWILLEPGAPNGSYFSDFTPNSVDPTLVGALITCSETSPLPRWDVNEDGLVSILDIALVVQHFGEEY